MSKPDVNMTEFARLWEMYRCCHGLDELLDMYRNCASWHPAWQHRSHCSNHPRKKKES